MDYDRDWSAVTSATETTYTMFRLSRRAHEQKELFVAVSEQRSVEMYEIMTGIATTEHDQGVLMS